MRLILLQFLLAWALLWEIGYYQSGTDWLAWDSSWKECLSSGSWTSWENYMFLDANSGLCQQWLPGEYFDFSQNKWSSWNGQWVGYWSYQTFCFTCAPTEILDLDTLSCISSCNLPQLHLTDNIMFTLGSIWRSLDYYIDPSTNKILEFGTKNYPYRTIQPVFLKF